MYPQSLSKEKLNLDLNSLPDFLKDPNPQVKFHSAFPPLTTKVRVRSVMERAGFDVYKPDISEKRSASSKPAFEPPRRIPFRSHSQSNLANFEKPPNHKGRNFTTSPMTSNSFPNLSNNTKGSEKSPTLNSSDRSTFSKRQVALEDTQNNLKLHTNRVADAIVPKIHPEISAIPVPVIPELKSFSRSDFNNNFDDSVVHEETDIFKNSTKLPPKTTHINGPRPFVDSDDDEAEGSFNKYSTIHSRNSSAATTATNELRSNFVDKNHMPGGFNRQVDLETPTIPTLNEDDSFESDNKLKVTNGSRLSNASANSISSFDAKFMNQDNYDVVSQNSYGGLKDIRSTFRSADFDKYEFQAEPVKKDYENAKRLSTLSTNDMKIYNLRSLNDNEIVDMSMIQEDDNEHSIIKSNYNIPDIVLDDAHTSNRNSFDNLERDDVIDPFSSAREDYHTPIGESTSQFVKNNNFDVDKAVDFDSDLHDNIENETDQDDNGSLYSKGFQKRTASAFSTPNINQNYPDVPPIPKAPEYPIEPQVNRALQPEIEAIIDDINNFEIDSNNNLHQQSGEVDNTISVNRHSTHSEGNARIPETQETNSRVVSNDQISIQYPAGEGPCRKCHQEILKHEKKIWSKDHQLTGQWHRKCFGCNKCGAKFNKGSSCYVFNNEPYCEEHFHELNGSLCGICNKGVEGECLQNDINEAFHTHCLTCVICGLSVQGDYFLFRDEVMCENDAKELMFQIEEAEKQELSNDSVEKSEKMIKRRTRILYL